jgi:hypothetical protein
MSLTLLIVFITAVVSGIGFWFYNRRQISSLTEILEDKNAVISSLRGHIESPTNNDNVPQKKKKRYSNRPKKNSNMEQRNNGSTKQSDQNGKSGRGRKPKNQQ